MWITVLFVTLVWFSQTQAEYCQDVLEDCQHTDSWTSCYENSITTCITRGRIRMQGYASGWVNSSQEAEVRPSREHRVHIPSSALQRSRGAALDEVVRVVATVINSTYFKVSRPPRARGRGLGPKKEPMQGTVVGGLVLAVRAGHHHVSDLPQPVNLTFKYNITIEDDPVCVFWQELLNGTGFWNAAGCDTDNTGTQCICSCNHLSFFAVLVNPALSSSVDKTNAVYLSYITYIGSAVSVVFTILSLIVCICLQRWRPEKAMGVHMQLTGALLCLHLSFLLCCFWGQMGESEEEEEGWVCRGLGLFLHWSLLATFSWTALEGFHLYLLLVRVFNIYVRRYLLKLSLVGWGIPTVATVVCGTLGVYGKNSLELRGDNHHNSTVNMCWMSSRFPQRLLVSYITTVAFPCLVILCNSCMLGLVVVKLRGLRREGSTSSKGKSMSREKGLWKDCATVLGLSCVLGLPWGLASTTYLPISLPGIYLFTILNSMQGLFMFLWCLALTCKFRSDNNSSVRDPSSQKMIMTSFNN